MCGWCLIRWWAYWNTIDGLYTQDTLQTESTSVQIYAWTSYIVLLSIDNTCNQSHLNIHDIRVFFNIVANLKMSVVCVRRRDRICKHEYIKNGVCYIYNQCKSPINKPRWPLNTLKWEVVNGKKPKRCYCIDAWCFTSFFSFHVLTNIKNTPPPHKSI